MGDFPKAKLCNCNETVRHCFIWLNEKCFLILKIRSIEIGEKAIGDLLQDDLISKEESSKLIAQIHNLGLFETESNAWAAMTKEERDLFRRFPKMPRNSLNGRRI